MHQLFELYFCRLKISSFYWFGKLLNFRTNSSIQDVNKYCYILDRTLVSKTTAVDAQALKEQQHISTVIQKIYLYFHY